MVIGVIFLLILFRNGVHTASCPASCKCVFNEKIDDNIAQCEWKDSSVNITWSTGDIVTFQKGFASYEKRNYICTINCQGTNYNCADMPRFDIKVDSVHLNLTSCAPILLRCVNLIHPKVKVIESVKIHDTRGQFASDDLKKLDQVKYIELYLKDDVTEIPLSTFNSLPTIEKVIITGGNLQLTTNVMLNEEKTKRISLKLNNNNITNLPDGSFIGLFLRELVISNNKIEHISAGAFRGLREVETLILRKNNKLKSIDPEAFSETQFLNIIVLEENAIEYLPNGIFHGLTKIIEVNVYNNLVELILGSELFANLNIRKIRLINSKISTLSEGIFAECNSLNKIDLSNNMIEVLPLKIFWDVPFLQEVILENNRISSIPVRIFVKSKKLRFVNLAGNRISVLRRNIFHSNPVLTEVWLDRNNLTELNMAVFNETNMFNLSICSNQIQRVVASSQLLLYLEKLYLQNNKISSIDDSVYELIGLSHLNLSNNNIDIFKEEYMYSQRKFHGAVIDLRYNNISNIIKNNRDSGHKPIRVKDTTLYLSNNSLQCECTVTTLLKQWRKDGALIDFEDIICTKGERLSNIKLYSICNENDKLIALVGSSAVGSLVIFIIIFSLFANRKDIWQYITNIFHSKHDHVTAYQIKVDELKTYDIFISFAHRDSEFVTDEILPKLENDFGQKVCVHYRDWLVGELIPDQIIKSVESSRMTLIILTEHFIESEWSYLEFHTAHNLGIQEGKSKVIIIILNENIIKSKKLSADLKSYIVVNNYLLWNDNNFWDKLQKILPREGKRQKKFNL